MLIGRLILKTQSVARVNPPKNRFDIDFALDKESTIGILKSCKSQKDVEQIQNAIEQATCLAFFKMDRAEFKNQTINPYLRTTFDATNINRLFGIQLQRSKENCFIVKKIRVFDTENKSLTDFDRIHRFST